MHNTEDGLVIGVDTALKRAARNRLANHSFVEPPQGNDPCSRMVRPLTILLNLMLEGHKVAALLSIDESERVSVLMRVKQDPAQFDNEASKI